MMVFAVCITVLLVSLTCGDLSGVSPQNADVQQEIVNVHNAFRRTVQPTATNMLKMSWNAQLSTNAQNWINNCNLTHGPPSSREIDGYQCGENLFKSNAVYNWTSVVGAWHNEVKNYQFPIGSINGNPIGHYTQVVWYGSYEVGCGVTYCSNSATYFYGCHYFRAGNFKEVPPYTKGDSCADCPNNCDDKLCTNPCPYIDKYSNCPNLVQTNGCGNSDVKEWCPSLCQCQAKIRPIAKK
nr:cysteine-rich venom protein-like [Paramormyrops kingsleyae]